MAYPTYDIEGVASQSVTVITATTAQLADVADDINTKNKYVGKPVYNTTTGVQCYADGAAAADTWSEADGTVEHSPA